MVIINNAVRDMLSGDTVFYSEVRALRPISLLSGGEGITPARECPFCPDNSAMLPPIKKSRGEFRVFDNKYPAVSWPGGIHEVLADTYGHNRSLSDFSRGELGALLMFIRDRMAELYAEPGIRYVQLFKNKGVNAGASQSHSHWQLVALPFVPERIEGMAANSRDASCPVCADNSDELVFIEQGGFAAVCPAFSRFAREISIRPREHIGRFIDFPDNVFLGLGEVFLNALKCLEAAEGKCDYNICLYDNYGANSHAHFNILPRKGRVAGLELSAGCFINHVRPETAAAEMRAVKI